ncbi:MAG TPA: class I SAM-dependent methyltransferase [Gaiellaceae bacterium]|nr:class I SAM-dependent methyltransferase [Gaiellaceae bacterium]
MDWPFSGRQPPLVTRALGLARELHFEGSSIPEVGRLLHVLAGQRGRARVGEIGAGTGVGAAWIVSALPPEVPFVTVELDPRLATAAAGLFAEDENVTVLSGDWHELLPPEAPFDLVFFDGGGKQRPDLDGEQVVGLLAPGGTVVLDDLTPGRSGPDPVREFWLEHSRLAAIELLTTPETAAILAVHV